MDKNSDNKKNLNRRKKWLVFGIVIVLGTWLISNSCTDSVWQISPSIYNANAIGSGINSGTSGINSGGTSGINSIASSSVDPCATTNSIPSGAHPCSDYYNEWMGLNNRSDLRFDTDGGAYDFHYPKVSRWEYNSYGKGEIRTLDADGNEVSVFSFNQDADKDLSSVNATPNAPYLYLLDKKTWKPFVAPYDPNNTAWASYPASLTFSGYSRDGHF